MDYLQAFFSAANASVAQMTQQTLAHEIGAQDVVSMNNNLVGKTWRYSVPADARSGWSLHATSFNSAWMTLSKALAEDKTVLGPNGMSAYVRNALLMYSGSLTRSQIDELSATAALAKFESLTQSEQAPTIKSMFNAGVQAGVITAGNCSFLNHIVTSATLSEITDRAAQLAKTGTASQVRIVEMIEQQATTAFSNVTRTGQAGVEQEDGLVQTDTSETAQLSNLIATVLSGLSNPPTVS